MPSLLSMLIVYCRSPVIDRLSFVDALVMIAAAAVAAADDLCIASLVTTSCGIVNENGVSELLEYGIVTIMSLLMVGVALYDGVGGAGVD